MGYIPVYTRRRGSQGENGGQRNEKGGHRSDLRTRKFLLPVILNALHALGHVYPGTVGSNRSQLPLLHARTPEVKAALILARLYMSPPAGPAEPALEPLDSTFTFTPDWYACQWFQRYFLGG